MMHIIIIYVSIFQFDIGMLSLRVSLLTVKSSSIFHLTGCFLLFVSSKGGLTDIYLLSKTQMVTASNTLCDMKGNMHYLGY